MKNILLSSVAIVAFAGAAAAEVTFSGSATLGYNDDYADGIYSDADFDITMTQELNNGWTATATYGLELSQKDQAEDTDNDQFSGDDNITLSLTNGTYTLTYGDTEHAAKSKWSGVSEMNADSFSEQDGEDVLKVEADFGSYAVAVSGIVDMADDADVTTVDETGDVKQSSFGATAEFGQFNVGLAYQEEAAGVVDASGDFESNEVLGIFAGATFAGADFKIAYAKSTDGTTESDSTGLEVSYPVGDITLGAFYVSESVGEDNYGVSAAYAANAIEGKVYYKSLNDSEEFGLGASYTMGDLVVTAGYVEGDSLTDDDFGTYIVADYDLGGGASIMASYADQENIGGGDDIDTVVGGYELKDGATVALSLKF